MPENVEAVRASIQQSPKRSPRKHATALGISSRSLRRILHADLKLHPYKMMLAQELSKRDHANRRAISAEILEQVSPCEFFLWGYLKEKAFKHF
jgi:methylphosphotriester-DNA--protein-cysteine methyltransferase